MTVLILFIWLSFFVTCISGTELVGYAVNSPFYTRWVYVFAHTGFFHTAMNTISMAIMTVTVRKTPCDAWDGRLGGAKLAIVSYICAVLATFGSAQEVQTVGASGIVFALFGMWAVSMASKQAVRAVLLTVLLNVPIALMLPVNSMNHLLAFLYGMLYGAVENRETIIQTIKKRCR